MSALDKFLVHTRLCELYMFRDGCLCGCADAENELATLRAQRDRLAEALKGVAVEKLLDGSLCWCAYRPDDGHFQFCKDAKAALEAVEKS